MKYKACTKAMKHFDFFTYLQSGISVFPTYYSVMKTYLFLKSSNVHNCTWMLKMYHMSNFLHHSSVHMSPINLHLTRRAVCSSGSLERCLTQYRFWLLRHREKRYYIMHNFFIYTNVLKNVSWKQCSYHIWK